jgi:TonB family protein
MSRRVVLTIALMACGGGQTTPAHVEIVQSLPDASFEAAAPVVVDDAWHGEDCRPLASRTSVHVDKVAVSGEIYDGRNHCYLDLPRALCFEITDDAGQADKLEVYSLQIGESCATTGEAEFRGKLDGPLVLVRRHGFAIAVDAASLARVTRDVVIAEIADKPTTRDDMHARFADCFRTSLTGGNIVLSFQVAADGTVTDARRESGNVPPDLEKCVVDAARENTKFAAGAARRVTMPVAFTRKTSKLL